MANTEPNRHCCVAQESPQSPSLTHARVLITGVQTPDTRGRTPAGRPGSAALACRDSEFSVNPRMAHCVASSDGTLTES